MMKTYFQLFYPFRIRKNATLKFVLFIYNQIIYNVKYIFVPRAYIRFNNRTSRACKHTNEIMYTRVV